MRKLNTGSFDNTLVEEYIKEVQAKLPKYKVDINNVNDFQVMLDEKNNCCTGIKHNSRIMP